MNLEIRCIVSHVLPEPMINMAIFETSDGSPVCIDRDQTEYIYNGYELNMRWRNCYIWDGNKELYLESCPKNIVFREFDIEDEAPELYRIKMVSYSFE